MSWSGLTWFSLIVTSYLIGGIPTAYLATRLLTGQDIRRLGDRNSGAANVFRNVSPRAGLIVGAVDIVKGVAAVLLVRGLVDSTPLAMAAGVAVLAGHNWPVHLGLRGGRGAATAIGVLMAMLPALGLPMGALSLVVLYFTKKAMFGLGTFLILVPILAWPTGYPLPVILYSVAIPLIVGLTHYLSVRRTTPSANPEIAQGEERPLPQGQQPP